MTPFLKVKIQATDFEKILHICHIYVTKDLCLQYIKNNYNSAIKKKKNPELLYVEFTNSLKRNFTK